MLDINTIAQLKGTLKASINNYEIAGASIMVIKNGKEAFYHNDGLADLETGRPITRDSIYRLYSMTK